ncbi:helix-turn-helix domain-containing protein [Bacillus thuringiensis]|uniref:helix-turn-helix domain-containing protein n=1 Tax=Bacillus thuringiensis TaxID=1428 RepID=UPI00159B9B6B|nr:helix-turn-helix transcriptional regulator [Bacillus thuringiensis]
MIRKQLGRLMDEQVTSVTDIVEGTGLPRNTILQLKKGLATNVDFNTLERLASYFEVHVSEFFEAISKPKETESAVCIEEKQQSRFEKWNELDLNALKKFEENEAVAKLLKKLEDSAEQINELTTRQRSLGTRCVTLFVQFIELMDMTYPKWRETASPLIDELREKINSAIVPKTE